MTFLFESCVAKLIVKFYISSAVRHGIAHNELSVCCNCKILKGQKTP